MTEFNLKSTIHSNQFMIIAFDVDSVDYTVRKTIYGTYAEALHKAQTFAGTFKGIKYIVVAVAAVAQAVENPVVVTSYQLKGG